MASKGTPTRRPEAGEATKPTPQEVLEEGLSAYLERPVRISRVKRRPLAVSSHAVDRLRVTLASGERLAVIFKRLQPGHELYGNEREVLVYRRLLGGQRFGAPALYASVYDEARGRYWLFLEDVGQRVLKHCGLEDWLAVVRLLAGMHGTYMGREEELRGLRCLGEHDADYYHLIATVARDHLHRAAAPRALDRFDELMERFPAVAGRLAGQPRTLVHGDILPNNFVLQPGRRIRPIDWESAAVGLGTWDLARLLDGWDEAKPTFIAAYLAELARHTCVPFDRRAFDRTLLLCDIVSVLWHLRWSAEACQDPEFVGGLLNELAACWDRVEKEGADG